MTGMSAMMSERLTGPELAAHFLETVLAHRGQRKSKIKAVSRSTLHRLGLGRYTDYTLRRLELELGLPTLLLSAIIEGSVTRVQRTEFPPDIAALKPWLLTEMGGDPPSNGLFSNAQ